MKKKTKPRQTKKTDTAAPSKFVVSGQQLATLFDVTLRTIQNWKNEKAMPNLGRDRYDLAEVIPWYVNWQVTDRVPAGSDEKRLAKAQADEREFKAKKLHMEYRKMVGELVERDTVERENLAKIIACKTALRGLSINLASLLVGVKDVGEIETIVEDEVDQCLRRFAGNGDDLDQAAVIFVKTIAANVAPAIVRLRKKETIAAKIETLLGADPWRWMLTDEVNDNG